MAVAGELAPLAGARSRALWALGCCHDAECSSSRLPKFSLHISMLTTGPLRAHSTQVVCHDADDLSGPEPDARWLVTRARPGQAREGGEAGGPLQEARAGPGSARGGELEWARRGPTRAGPAEETEDLGG
jgi:hypothetical protein